MGYPYYSFQLRTVGESSADSAMPSGICLDGSSEYTISAWIYLTDNSGIREIVSQGDNFTFGVERQCLLIRMGENIVAESANALKTLTWYHVAVVFDKNNFRFYCDGDMVSSVTWDGRTYSLSGDISIGRNLNGYIRNIAMFSSALSPDDIRAKIFDYSGAAAFYDFTANPAVEHVGGLEITYDGIADIVKTAKAAFFKDQGYLRIDERSEVNPGGIEGEPYTIQAWIYLDTGNGNGCCTILHNTNITNDSGILLTLERDITGGVEGFHLCLRHGLFDDDTNFLRSDMTVKQKTWTNIAVVFDEDNCKLYIDCVLQREKSGILPIAANMTDSVCYIGSKVNGGNENGDDVFEGAISRIDIWDKALSHEEIVKYAEKIPDSTGSDKQPKASFFFGDSYVNLVDYIPAGRRRGITLDMTESEKTKRGEQENGSINTVSDPYAGIEIPNELRLKAIEDYFAEYKLQNGVSLEQLPHDFFAVNHFSKDKTIYFVVHQQTDSYIVTDLADDDDMDVDYIIWLIELVIIVVGGICSILFGLKFDKSRNISQFIRQRIAGIASLRTIFHAATDTSIALCCINFILEIYNNNVFTALLRFMFDISFFTVICIVAKLIAKAIGGVAGLLIEIAALGITVMLHIQKYPSSPLALSEIDFTGLTNSTGSIPCSNSNDLTKSTAPEWRTINGSGSPVLFCISDICNGNTPNKITVRVRMAINSPYNKKVKIRAVDLTNSGEGLGNSEEAEINLNGFTKETEFISISFPDHTIRTAVNSFILRLEWQCKTADQLDWKRCGVSENTVYVSLDFPGEPWSGAILPWLPFIEITYPWIRGLKKTDDIQKTITKKINSSTDIFVYDVNRGASRYSKLKFDYIQLRKDLYKNGNKYPVSINCSDCADIVTLLSNLWGCDLSVKLMSGNSKNFKGFELNEIIAIGTDVWKIPFQGRFSYHAIAADTNTSLVGNRDIKVYDACLEYDNRTTPWDNASDSARVRYLPTGVAFSQYIDFPTIPMSKAPDDSYREHLAANSSEGAGICQIMHIDTTILMRGAVSIRKAIPHNYREYYLSNRTLGTIAYDNKKIYLPMPELKGYMLVESRSFYGIRGSYHNSYVSINSGNDRIEVIFAPCEDHKSAEDVLLYRTSTLASGAIEITETESGFEMASLMLSKSDEDGSVKMACMGNAFIEVTATVAEHEKVCNMILKNAVVK